MRLESEDAETVGAAPGVEVPDRTGVDEQVDWGSEDEKSVICVKV
jgi:hypothetical protein